VKIRTLGQLLVWTLGIASGFAQGTFVYDQQSSVDTLPGEIPVIIQQNAPIGQSFTPTLSAVGFIRLNLSDRVLNNGNGATIYLNLRASSITGPILASSTPVSMPDGFVSQYASYPTFFFEVPVVVTPGTTYYFDLVAEPGSDTWAVVRYIYGTDYVGGTDFISGQPGHDDLWFREGIVVPEPCSAALLLFGGGVLLGARRHFRLVRGKN
jgi:hypothetical protein